MQEPTDVDEKALRRYAKAVDDAAGSAERAIHDATGRDVPLREAAEPPPPARTAYDENAEPQRFRDRLAEKASTQTKSIQDTFG